MTGSTLTECILEILREGGRDTRSGGRMNLLEHSLQAAAFAEQSGAPDSLVVAALLHDIGHLLNTTESDDRPQDAGAQHEALGAAWLSIGFSRAVTQPIRLHVAAKRFLSAVEPDYVRRLSSAAQDSLPRQGGPMTADEVNAFRGTLWARDAVVLRRWDDAASTSRRPVPGLEHYRPRIAREMEMS